MKETDRKCPSCHKVLGEPDPDAPEFIVFEFDRSGYCTQCVYWDQEKHSRAVDGYYNRRAREGRG
jgi:hypothetical protein